MPANGMAFFQANFVLQSPHDREDHHLPPTYPNQILTPRATSQDYHGKRSVSFSSSPGGIDVWDEPNTYNGEEDMSDNEGSQVGEKKRRLNMEQVKALEKSFELRNKLEPERKMQLAKALNLQPRQIAIWFQNRRARWKTKQLERDYGLLKRQFDAIKAENDALQTKNQKLHSEILALKNRESTESINLNKETDQGSSSNRSENSSDIKLDISSLRPTNGGVLQFFQNSTTRPDHDVHSHGHKSDQVIKEEGFTNVFTGIDDQNGFWPWLEQQHFNLT